MGKVTVAAVITGESRWMQVFVRSVVWSAVAAMTIFRLTVQDTSRGGGVVDSLSGPGRAGPCPAGGWRSPTSMVLFWWGVRNAPWPRLHRLHQQMPDTNSFPLNKTRSRCDVLHSIFAFRSETHATPAWIGNSLIPAYTQP
jgi:hypothetical protein